MNINVENEKINRLLHRTEIKCRIDTDGRTPSRQEIVKKIAAKKGVNEDLVIVDRINQEYGKKEATAYVKVYESKKTAQTIEAKHKIERSNKKPKTEAPSNEATPEDSKKGE